jgi:hypothetical protein
MTTPTLKDRSNADEPPPFWGRWGRIYLFVAMLLLVQTIAFFVITQWSS